MDKQLHLRKQCDVISDPSPDYNGGWLKLGHWWLITSHVKCGCNYLSMPATSLVSVKYPWWMWVKVKGIRSQQSTTKHDQNDISLVTDTQMSSFWRNFHHWLHWKLLLWQLPVESVMKTKSKWKHFRFSGTVSHVIIWMTRMPRIVYFRFCKNELQILGFSQEIYLQYVCQIYL